MKETAKEALRWFLQAKDDYERWINTDKRGLIELFNPFLVKRSEHISANLPAHASHSRLVCVLDSLTNRESLDIFLKKTGV